MKRKSIIVVVGMLLAFNSFAQAVTNYSGNEEDFNDATAGLSKTLIDFDDLTLNDVISTQYESLNVRFSTYDGHDIIAKESAYGPSARSSPLCAEVWYDDVQQLLKSTFTIEFLQPVWGVSLYVGDINGYVDMEVLNMSGQSLLLEPVNKGGVDWTHVAVLSDLQNIGKVIITAGTTGDGIGLDDVTVIPEPATLLLLSLGAVMLRRKR